LVIVEVVDISISPLLMQSITVYSSIM